MMQRTIAQKDVVHYLQQHAEFRISTGNMRGHYTIVDGTRIIYEVYSYAELIGRIEYVDGVPTIIWITPKKFSVTTSKHTNYVKRAWASFIEHLKEK